MEKQTNLHEIKNKSSIKKISLNIDITNNYLKSLKKKKFVIIFMLILMLIFLSINLSIGSSNQNLFEIINNTMAGNEQSLLLLFNLRLPHCLCSIIAGAVLGICGCILQSSLVNPLASPSTIGISQGASCGACIAIVLFSSIFSINNYILVIVSAFIFAIIPTLLIYSISKFKHFNSTSIVLTGISMSIFFSGIVAIVQYFADASKVSEVIFWTFGSVYNTNLNSLAGLSILLLLLFIYAIYNRINFNALECGDNVAHSVGINVQKSRLRNLLIAALASACITAFCGTINFIGLLAPHIMRKIIGSNYKLLIPCSALCGASLLSLSDILSSAIISGVILPIGAITSFIGAPIFIYVLLKNNGRF